MTTTPPPPSSSSGRRCRCSASSPVDRRRARAIYGWGSYYLSRQCALSLRHRELVIDRTTARLSAAYEWGIHVAAFAGRAALTAEQVASLGHGTAADTCWPADDAAVIAAVDALVDGADLDDGSWRRLVDAVGEEGALDLLLVCGWYHAISFVARSARLEPEPGAAAL